MEIFGIKLNKLYYSSFFEKIKYNLKNDKRSIIFTPNPEILLKTLEDNEFKKYIQKANYLTIDGIGIYIGLQILEKKRNFFTNLFLLPYYFFNLFFRRKYLIDKYGERICGSDLTKDLLLYAQKNKIKIVVLDPYYPQDKNKVEAQRTFSEKLKKVFPLLEFDFFIYKNKEDVIHKICNSNAKILFSTLGMKKQEKSVIKIMQKCKNIKLGLGVGSSFDYFIGFQKRAPKIFRIIGLEWFYRIFTGPQKIKRLKRIYNAIFIFIYHTLK